MYEKRGEQRQRLRQRQMLRYLAVASDHASDLDLTRDEGERGHGVRCDGDHGEGVETC